MIYRCRSQALPACPPRSNNSLHIALIAMGDVTAGCVCAEFILILTNTESPAESHDQWVQHKKVGEFISSL